MLLRSASDVATNGMYRTMKNTKASGKDNRQLRLLLVGGSEQDFADLRELLAETGESRPHLKHAASAEDVADQFGGGSYDILFCSSKSTDNVAFQLLRQVRKHDS